MLWLHTGWMQRNQELEFVWRPNEAMFEADGTEIFTHIMDEYQYTPCPATTCRTQTSKHQPPLLTPPARPYIVALRHSNNNRHSHRPCPATTCRTQTFKHQPPLLTAPARP